MPSPVVSSRIKPEVIFGLSVAFTICPSVEPIGQLIQVVPTRDVTWMSMKHKVMQENPCLKHPVTTVFRCLVSLNI
jgi:hypothetical protein